MIRDVGKADPDLLAVEPVRTAVGARRRGEVRGVRADPGLGEPEGRELLAPCLWHEPSLPLRLGSPLQQCKRVQPDVDALNHAECGIRPLQLLAQDREADVIHP